MIELDDCGRELHLRADRPWSGSMDIIVQMVIKSPRGTLTLFENVRQGGQAKQRKAIKAFMEEHKDD